MKKITRLVVCLALAAGVTRAAVTEGENIILNGKLEADQAPFPPGWHTTTPEYVRYERAGGPNGMPCVTIFSEKPAPLNPGVAQSEFVLVPGEKYRISARIRTRGYKSRYGGIAVYNSGWWQSMDLKGLPENSDWTERTVEAVAPKSDNGLYYIDLFAVKIQGEISFSDVRLFALTPKGQAGSSGIDKRIMAPRLVPISPLLEHIPVDAARLSFRWFGILKRPIREYDIRFSAVGKTLLRRKLTGEPISVPLNSLGIGRHTVTATIAFGAEPPVFTREYAIRIIKQTPLNLSGTRRLNNLVTELLAKPITGQGGAFFFANPRDGWVFISLKPAVDSPNLSLKLDGAACIGAATERLEAFRYLSRGLHALDIAGLARGGAVRVNAIPELLCWAPCVASFVPANGSYDWDYHRKYCLKAWTTFSISSINNKIFPETQKLGLRWLTNCISVGLKSSDMMLKRLEENKAMNPGYGAAGITCDELFFGSGGLDHFTDALRKYKNPLNKLIYPWIVGTPGGMPALETDFISTSLNASGGRGKLLIEAYCHLQRDEETARKYLDNVIIRKTRMYNQLYPGINPKLGFIFGSFNQPAIISLEHTPAADFKYFIDMQLNTLANAPECDGIGITGFWGTYDGEDEFHRWSFTVLRHYAVEGATNMLSPKYGFTYNPGHLVNPDFEDGLNGWICTPAAKDTIAHTTISGLGRFCEARWGAGGGTGDKCCSFTRRDGTANRISTVATGLVPGKMYQFQCLSADGKDARAKIFAPKEVPLTITLSNTEIQTPLSFNFVNRKPGGKSNTNKATINIHRIVFKAKAATSKITITDEKAAPGTECVFNFVQLKPYYERE